MIEKILDAAETLVAREGFGSLTMDSVSAEAGVSKGAIQHHFRSKNAIVEALAARKVSSLRSEIERANSSLPASGSRALLGMVRHAEGAYDDDQSFPHALLSEVTASSQVNDPFKAMFKEMLDRVQAESQGQTLHSVLVFAVMGLLPTKSLGLCSLELSEADRLFDEIVKQAMPSGNDQR